MTSDGLQAFVAQYWEDRKAGRVRDLPEYLAMFPGDANAIAREFLALEAPPQGALEGESVGPYRIEEEIGRGGQGVVYKATDTRVGRVVALKVLHALGPGSQEVILRFQREARVASRLDDPGICTVYDTGMEGGVPYIAMRYVEGASVARMISTRKECIEGEGHSTCVSLSPTEDEEGAPPPPESEPKTAREAAPGSRDVMEVAAFFEKVARSLHEAHEAGVIHRDIKPGNIMLTPKGEPVIMDFGLARGEEVDLQTLTRTGEFFGTPAYMSPEQLLAQRVKLDRRTDIWSLGVSLYECLTLKRPFEAPTREGLYQAIQSKDPEDPRRVNRQIPKDLATVVTVCLAKDRDRRYQSALQLADDLRRLQRREPIAARPIGPVERLLRWAQRRPYRAASLVLAFLGIASVSWYVAKAPERAALEEKARLREADERKQELEALLHDAYLCIHERVPPVALEIFEQAVALVPDDPEAVAGLAIALTLADRRDDARRLLDQHLTDDGTKPAGLAHVRHWVTLKEGAPLAPADTYPPETAQDHFLFGYLRLLEDYGDEDLCREALPHFTRATVLSAPRCLHLVCRARAAEKIEDAEVAAECEDALLRLWPYEAYAWYGVAVARFGEERKQERREAYERAAELRPFAPSLHNLSLILKAEGQKGAALEGLERATASSPGYYLAWYSLGGLLNDLGRHEEALEAYDRTVQIKSDHHWAWARKGWTLRVLERHEEAIEACEQAIGLKPDLVHAWNLKGVVLCDDLERYADALEAFEQAIRLRPGDATAWFNKGQALRRLGRAEEAIEAYDRAIGLKGDHANAWGGKGIVLRDGLKRYADALEAFEQAIRLSPGDAPAWFNKGQALQSLGRTPEAIQAYDQAIALDPDFAPAWNGKGVVLRDSLKRHADALEAFEQAIRLSPGDAPAWFNKGQALKSLGRTPEAIKAYDQAIELDPDCAQAWVTKGAELGKLGLHQDALLASERAIDIRRSDFRAWNNKAISLTKLGRSQEAITAYHEAIRIHPRYRIAHLGLVWLLNQERELDALLAEHKRWAKVCPKDATAHHDLAREFLRIGRREPDLAAPQAALAAARKAVLLTEGKDPAMLKTLAMALAANDEPAEARKCCEQALALLEKQEEPDPQLKADLRSLLRRFGDAEKE